MLLPQKGAYGTFGESEKWRGAFNNLPTTQTAVSRCRNDGMPIERISNSDDKPTAVVPYRNTNIWEIALHSRHRSYCDRRHEQRRLSTCALRYTFPKEPPSSMWSCRKPVMLSLPQRTKELVAWDCTILIPPLRLSFVVLWSFDCTIIITYILLSEILLRKEFKARTDYAEIGLCSS